MRDTGARTLERAKRAVVTRGSRRGTVRRATRDQPAAPPTAQPQPHTDLSQRETNPTHMQHPASELLRAVCIASTRTNCHRGSKRASERSVCAPAHPSMLLPAACSLPSALSSRRLSLSTAVPIPSPARCCPHRAPPAHRFAKSKQQQSPGEQPVAAVVTSRSASIGAGTRSSSSRSSRDSFRPRLFSLLLLAPLPS